MPFSTRAELETAVANWLNKTNLAAFITDFVDLGVARIRRDQLWDRRVHSIETENAFTVSAQGEELPTGVKAVLEMWSTSGDYIGPLEQTSFAGLRKLANSNNDETGTPKVYAIVPPRDPAIAGARLFLWPRPSGSYPVDFLYVRDVGPLGAGGSELLTFAPDAYLFAALSESAPFLRDDERVPVWSSRYDLAIAALNRQPERAAHGASEQRPILGAVFG